VVRFTGAVVHDILGLQEQWFMIFEIFRRSDSCFCLLEDEWFMFLRFTGGVVYDFEVNRRSGP
jgi:hypothetical protein